MNHKFTSINHHQDEKKEHGLYFRFQMQILLSYFISIEQHKFYIISFATCK
jgi:hypothetical protein